MLEGMATGVAAMAALMAACCFAVAAVLQQDVASRAPQSQALRPRLVWELAHQPTWLAGIGLSAFSYVLQGTALAFGPLVLVQPLAATDLIFALALVSWRRRTRLAPVEAAGAACLTAGIAAFLTVLPPSGPVVSPALLDWAWTFLAVGGLAAALVLTGLRTSGRARTGLYAVAAGLLFALLAALTKSTAVLFRTSGAEALAQWEPYALLVTGGLGLLLAQSSFQAGPLAVSLPFLDTVEPIGGVLIGAVVFHERLAESPWALAVQLLGALAAVTGIVLLDRSPLARS